MSMGSESKRLFSHGSIKYVVLYFFVMGTLLPSPLIAWGFVSSTCHAPTDNNLEHVKTYLARKLHRNTSDLTLNIVDQPGKTLCFTKLLVDDHASTDRFTIYLSANGHYLTSEIYDLSVDPLEEEKAATKRLAIRLRENVKSIYGSPAGPLELVVFSDFQCPYCKRFSEAINVAMAHNDQPLTIVYRALPLASHAWSFSVASMAACVQLQNAPAFWNLYREIYEHQEAITVSNARATVDQLIREQPSLSFSDYTKCMATKEGNAQVKSDLNLARDLAVSSTPTFFINGVRHEGSVSEKELVEMLTSTGKSNKAN